MITIRDIIFIFNPNSGTRKSVELIEELKAVNPEVDYFVSHSLHEFDAFFKSEINKYKAVVICGGDGTINTTLKYLIGKNIALAVLPNGSGNGFARELGFTTNIQKLLDHILKGKTLAVDLIRVNNDLSCNVTGLGIDSYVTTEFDKSRDRGLKGYIYNGLKAYFRFKPIDVTLTFNDSTISGKYMMVCIANTRQFGNGAFIAPNAKYDDGMLEIVLIKPIPLHRMPSLVFRVFKGTLSDSKYVEFHQASEISIKSNSESYHVDGEPKVMKEDLEVAIINSQIKVIDMHD